MHNGQIYYYSISDLNFDLSKLLKVKSDSTDELPNPTYNFLLVFNSNKWRSNTQPHYDIPPVRLQNLSNLDFDLSRLPKVKCDDVIHHVAFY